MIANRPWNRPEIMLYRSRCPETGCRAYLPLFVDDCEASIHDGIAQTLEKADCPSGDS